VCVYIYIYIFFFCSGIYSLKRSPIWQSAVITHHSFACLWDWMWMSVRSMTARCDRWRSNGSSRTTMTSPTTIYLDRDKSSRTNTSNCPSRVRLTKKRNLPPLDSRGNKRRAFRCRSSDQQSLDPRSRIEKYPRRCLPRIFSRIHDVGKRIRGSRLNVLTSSPSRLDLFYIFTTSSSFSRADLVRVAGRKSSRNASRIIKPKAKTEIVKLNEKSLS